MFDPSDDPTLIDAVERLASMIKAARCVVMLTGAGISTESGIPDFRSPGGLWSTYRPIHYIDYIRKPALRSEYWSRSHVTVPMFASASPNAAHYAVAAMQQAGRIHALITQNIDELHQRAGSPTVLELHGSYLWARCIACGVRCTRVEVHQRMAEVNPPQAIVEGRASVPACAQCGGLLKPDVVFFGENVPSEITAQAVATAQSAALFIVVGSSLAVYSGYRLPLRALEAGATLALVNLGPTRIDARADLLLRARAGLVLPLVAARVSLP
jgi:NAD-dependent deacetylase sirtuin 4